MSRRFDSTTIFSDSLARAIDAEEFGPQQIQMFSSDATARVLVANETGAFGADLLRFPPGGRVPMHTHLGDHILLVLKGHGTLVSDDGRIALRPGLIYFVGSQVPHSIEARTELVLIAIGNDRKSPGSVERLAVLPPSSDAT